MSSSIPAESNRMTYWPVSVKISRPNPLKLRLMDATRPDINPCTLCIHCDQMDSRSSRSLSQKSHAKRPLSILANWEKVSSSRLDCQPTDLLMSQLTGRRRMMMMGVIDLRLEQVVFPPPWMPLPSIYQLRYQERGRQLKHSLLSLPHQPRIRPLRSMHENPRVDEREWTPNPQYRRA